MLISEEYRRVQSALHRDNPGYGVASVLMAPLVMDVVERLGVQEILDYGAGKGRLAQELNRTMTRPPRIRCYDPAMPEWSAAPQPAPLVVCLDVLEHIEPDCLDAVLDDLQRVVRPWGLFTVHTGPAMKVLPDGRNAHLIQQPPKWWLQKLLDRFTLVQFKRSERGFWVIVEALDYTIAEAAPGA